jgi:hypothetical protein
MTEQFGKTDIKLRSPKNIAEDSRRGEYGKIICRTDGQNTPNEN